VSCRVFHSRVPEGDSYLKVSKEACRKCKYTIGTLGCCREPEPCLVLKGFREYYYFEGGLND